MNTKNCKRCGLEFTKPKKYSATQWAGKEFCSHSCAAKKHDIDTDQLVSMYVDEKMSSNDIGKNLGISAVHVLRILISAGVERRPSSENKSLALSKPETREKMRLSAQGRQLSEKTKAKLRLITGGKNANWLGGMTITSQGYITFTASPENGDKAGRLLHVVIAEWLYQRKLKPGEHVHHIDGNKLNNNPENLCIVSASEHAKIHNLGEKGNGQRLKSM